jgi:hypothetical protein
MIDASTRGSHDLEKIIYKLKQENLKLREELQALQKTNQTEPKTQHNELGT